MSLKNNLIGIIIIIWTFLGPVYAQDNNASADESNAFELSEVNEPVMPLDQSENSEATEITTPENEKSLFEKTLELDIDTADYYELITWCRQLGLDEKGDVNQLKKRLLNHFKITQESSSKKEAAKRKVEIKSAHRSEYFTISGIDESYILLEGQVFLEIEDADDKVVHQIKANRLLVNQEQNTLSAENDIEYTITRPNDPPETFVGESFSFNMTSWEGVFYASHGTSNREIEENNSVTFVYYGDVMSRLENDVVILENGRISSQVNMEDPNWKIKATRIWVLAPDEWAIQDAVLYMGRVPVFYIPFFFYAGDELFFNPVLGARDREGSYLQTTTYLIGDKKQKKSSISVFRVAQDSKEGYDKVIDGLFLRKRKTETPSVKYPENWILKIMVDLYTKIGGFAGIQLNLPPEINLVGGIGISRSIFLKNWLSSNGQIFQTYTPYYVLEDGSSGSIWNYTIINGLPLPFRYGLETQFNLKNTAFTLNGDFQIFSDPYFPQDFYTRSENFELTEILEDAEESSTTNSEDQTLNNNVRSNLKWFLSSTMNFTRLTDLPSFISTLELNRFYADFSWLTRSNPDLLLSPSEELNVDPARTFYIPEKFAFPDTKLRIRGEIFNISTSPLKNKKIGNVDEQKILPGKGLLIPETNLNPIPKKKNDDESDIPKSRYLLPKIKPNQPLAHQAALESSSSLNYSSESSLLVENYIENPDNIYPEEVSYNMEYSQLKGDFPVTLTFSAELIGTMIKISNNLGFSNTYKTHFNKSDSLSWLDWQAMQKKDFQESFAKINNNFNLSINPLLFYPSWKATKLSYSLASNLYEKIFDEMSGNTPVYKDKFVEWDKGYITEHQINTLISYNFDPAVLSLTQNAEIPPLDVEISEALAFSLGPSTTTLSTIFKEQNKPYYFEPLKLKEELNFSPYWYFDSSLGYDFNKSEWAESVSNLNFLKLNNTGSYIFSQNMKADINNPEILSLRSTISYSDLSFIMQFTKSREYSFDLNEEVWNENLSTSEILRPQSINFRYNSNLDPLYLWKNRIYLLTNIYSNWNINFLKFSDSRFNFDFTLKLRVHKFLDFEFTSHSYNNRTYRYFPGLAELVNETDNDLFYDLIRSFNFFDDNERKKSDLKNKDFDIAITHYLDDWSFKFKYTGKYSVINSRNVWDQEFSFFIEWFHIPEMKKKIAIDENNENRNLEFKDLWTDPNESSQ